MWNKVFSKLKDKLKESLSLFSKKTEEEAEEKEVEEVIEKKIEKKLAKKEKKEADSTEVKKEKPTTKISKEKVEEKNEEIKVKEEAEPEQVDEEKTEEEPESVEEVTKEESLEEKKGFFSKIKESFSKKEEESVEEEKIEKVEVPKPIEKEAETVQETEEEKKGFFTKVKQTITTKTISEDKFQDLFWDLELALLENNVSISVIEKIKDDLKNELVDKPLPRDVPAKIQETLKNTLTEILSFDKPDLIEQIKQQDKKPFVITFFGINGAGKTTSIAKVANYLQENGFSVVLAACDTFRAAAIQQLEEHANKLKIKMIKHDYGSDAAAVAFDAVRYGEKNEIDVVMIDTAGRLHSNTNLMAELEKIIRIAKPDLKLFVGESITGNDCIEQAQKFNELVEMDGTILTKADIDEKGGAPLSITYTINKPIFFLGMGQEYKDLEVFDKNVILERLGF